MSIFSDSLIGHFAKLEKQRNGQSVVKDAVKEVSTPGPKVFILKSDPSEYIKDSKYLTKTIGQIQDFFLSQKGSTSFEIMSNQDKISVEINPKSKQPVSFKVGDSEIQYTEDGTVAYSQSLVERATCYLSTYPGTDIPVDNQEVLSGNSFVPSREYKVSKEITCITQATEPPELIEYYRFFAHEAKTNNPSRDPDFGTSIASPKLTDISEELEPYIDDIVAKNPDLYTKTKEGTTIALERVGISPQEEISHICNVDEYRTYLYSSLTESGTYQQYVDIANKKIDKPQLFATLITTAYALSRTAEPAERIALKNKATEKIKQLCPPEIIQESQSNLDEV